MSARLTSFRVYLNELQLDRQTALEAQRIGTLPPPELQKIFSSYHQARSTASDATTTRDRKKNAPKKPTKNRQNPQNRICRRRNAKKHVTKTTRFLLRQSQKPTHNNHLPKEHAVTKTTAERAGHVVTVTLAPLGKESVTVTHSQEPSVSVVGTPNRRSTPPPLRSLTELVPRGCPELEQGGGSSRRGLPVSRVTIRLRSLARIRSCSASCHR